MKESRFVVTVNRVLNVIFASGLLVLWLAFLRDGTAFPLLRETQETNFFENYPQQNPIYLSIYEYKISVKTQPYII